MEAMLKRLRRSLKNGICRVLKFPAVVLAELSAISKAAHAQTLQQGYTGTMQLIQWVGNACVAIGVLMAVMFLIMAGRRLAAQAKDGGGRQESVHGIWYYIGGAVLCAAAGTIVYMFCQQIVGGSSTQIQVTAPNLQSPTQ